ncbi:MAG: DUF1476 domain-containing protein [Alphaproteobacteria bacterium]
MTTFKDREKAFEAKYRHDQETEFKVMVRRNKLLGQWAGPLIGLTGADAEAYTKEVIKSDFEKAGDDDVLQKVFKDFTDKGVGISEHRLRKEMDHLLEVAKEQIRSEAAPDTPQTI